MYVSTPVARHQDKPFRRFLSNRFAYSTIEFGQWTQLTIEIQDKHQLVIHQHVDVFLSSRRAAMAQPDKRTQLTQTRSIHCVPIKQPLIQRSIPMDALPHN